MFDEAAQRLRTRFSVAARSHARSTMASYRRKDAPGFYLNAGTSLELAIKARLMAHGAFTIGPESNKWFDQVLQVVRDPASNSTERSAKTVGAIAGLDRLRKLEPGLEEVLDRHVKETIGRCETVKHMGLGEPTEPGVLLSHVAAFVNAHQALIETSPSEFWGDEHPLAVQLVADRVNQVAVTVNSRQVDARARITTLGEAAFEDLASSAAQRVAEAADGERWEWIEIECPVCGSVARGYGNVEDRGEGEAEYEGPHEVSWHWVPRPVTLIHSFVCDVCEFHVSGRAELLTAEIPTVVDNSRISSSDLAALDFS